MGVDIYDLGRTVSIHEVAHITMDQINLIGQLEERVFKLEDRIRAMEEGNAAISK